MLSLSPSYKNNICLSKFSIPEPDIDIQLINGLYGFTLKYQSHIFCDVLAHSENVGELIVPIELTITENDRLFDVFEEILDEEIELKLGFSRLTVSPEERADLLNYFTNEGRQLVRLSADTLMNIERKFHFKVLSAKDHI
jgi:hypothetical protein